MSTAVYVIREISMMTSRYQT